MSTKKDLVAEPTQEPVQTTKVTAQKGVKYFEGKTKDGRTIKFPYRNSEQLKIRKKKFLN